MSKTKSDKKASIHVKVGDRVVVTSGKDKGKMGNVKKVITKDATVLVEGVNIVTKAQKANPMAGIQGGLNKMEAPLNASKIMQSFCKINIVCAIYNHSKKNC